MHRLVQQNPDMTAVMVSNYEMTVGAMIEANEKDIRIPEQLSIIGFDNVEFAKASVPKLSIVTQPTKEIAHNVAELMLKRLEGEAKNYEPETVRLTTGFIKGKSVNVLN